MPQMYGKDAHELCRKFYVEFGGNAKQIEKAMRKTYPKWSRNNLIDNEDRHGWVTKFGYEHSLNLHLQNQIHSVENDDERSYKVLVELGRMYEEKALSGDDKAINALLKINDQKIEFRNKLDLSSSSFETFVDGFEKVIFWATEIDIELAKLFFRNKDRFIKKAELEYGKSADNG